MKRKGNGHMAGLEMVDWILRSGPLFLVVKFPPVPMQLKLSRKVGLLGKPWDTMLHPKNFSCPSFYVIRNHCHRVSLELIDCSP